MSVTLPALNMINKLAEEAGTIVAAKEVDKIESEYGNYNISTREFIEDIDAVEKENTKRIEKVELEDENIKWLEQQLTSIKDEFSRKTGIPV